MGNCNHGSDGSPGGDSQITDSASNVLADAGGGYSYDGNYEGGIGGSGPNVVGRNGSPGYYAPDRFGSTGVPGMPGTPPAGSIQLKWPNIAVGGHSTENGYPGYVLITW